MRDDTVSNRPDDVHADRERLPDDARHPSAADPHKCRVCTMPPVVHGKHDIGGLTRYSVRSACGTRGPTEASRVKAIREWNKLHLAEIGTSARLRELEYPSQPSSNPERLDGWPDGPVEWPITVNMVDQDVELADEAQARDLHDTLTRILKLSR